MHFGESYQRLYVNTRRESNASPYLSSVPLKRRLMNPCFGASGASTEERSIC